MDARGFFVHAQPMRGIRNILRCPALVTTETDYCASIPPVSRLAANKPAERDASLERAHAELVIGDKRSAEVLKLTPLSLHIGRKGPRGTHLLNLEIPRPIGNLLIHFTRRISNQNEPALISFSMDALLRSKPVAVGLGLLTHLITNSGEWEHRAHILIPGGALLFGALVAYESVADPRVVSSLEAFKVVATVAAVYLGTLTASIVIYRTFFHRFKI